MKIMWCWRCKQEVPMLDEDEFKSVEAVYYDCVRSIKKYRQDNGVSLQDTPLNELYKPVVMEYERITGMPNCHHNAIMHHCASIYGVPCKACGKPLRTPRAKYCAACGQKP